MLEILKGNITVIMSKGKIIPKYLQIIEDEEKRGMEYSSIKKIIF